MKTTSAALSHVDTLIAYLKDRLPHRRVDALRRIAEVLFGIIQAESTLHRKIALHLPRAASQDSKTRRVARVFHDANLTEQDVLDILLPLLPEGKLTLVMDRTNGHHGQTPLNILALGVAIGGVVLPLTWTLLTHQGNSDARTRIALVARLLKRLPARRWAVLLADRGFIGIEWFRFLRWKGIKRCIRIKETTRIDDLLAREQFQNLKPGDVRSLLERGWVYDSWMQVVVTLSPEGEQVIVASDLPIWDTLETYRVRWGIECAFSALKTWGLGLEQTHTPDRLARLFGLLSVVLAWMVRVGDWRASKTPIRVKKHGRPAVSRARYGWEFLSEAIRWGKDSFQTCLLLLRTPFSAPGQQKP